MARVHYRAVNHYEVLAGGRVNINIRADIAGMDSPVLIRIYLRGPKAAHRDVSALQYAVSIGGLIGVELINTTGR